MRRQQRDAIIVSALRIDKHAMQAHAGVEMRRDIVDQQSRRKRRQAILADLGLSPDGVADQQPFAVVVVTQQQAVVPARMPRQGHRPEAAVAEQIVTRAQR